jgi:cytochrome c peroxidase
VHKPAGEPGEGITYWPFPEVNVNVDQTIGHLGLTDAEENQIVLFLQTLSDGFFVPPVKFNELHRPVQTTDHPHTQR